MHGLEVRHEVSDGEHPQPEAVGLETGGNVEVLGDEVHEPIVRRCLPRLMRPLQTEGPYAKTSLRTRRASSRRIPNPVVESRRRHRVTD
jgi:hypothetical protein